MYPHWWLSLQTDSAVHVTQLTGPKFKSHLHVHVHHTCANKAKSTLTHLAHDHKLHNDVWIIASKATESIWLRF